MVGRGASLLLSVITPMILVRIFSVGEYGEYRQVMLIVTTAAMFLPLGCPISLYYFLPHFPEAKGKYLSRTIAVMMLTGGLFCLFMWLRAEDVSRFFNNANYLETGLLIGVLAFMLAASSLIDTVLLADGRVILSIKVMIQPGSSASVNTRINEHDGRSYHVYRKTGR